MKRFTFLLFLFTCLYLHADEYVILQMNTNSIKIGEVLCKRGDHFSDSDHIYWSNYEQAFKAKNLKTKEIRLFASRAFNNYKARSVKEFYIKNNHLSTRGSNSLSDLKDEELADTIYLFGSIPFSSPILIDSLSSYIISYLSEGKTKWCTLMSNDDNFFLSRELFGEKNKDEKLKLTLYFRRIGLEDYLVTDELNVVLLPQEIDE